MRLSSLVFALTLGLASLSGGAWAQGFGPQHVQTQLVAETRGATPGSTVYVALVQKIDAGWHTYWRNPGDAGEATTLAWTLPGGWRAGDIVWPAPKRLPLGPLMNYGYEGQVLLPVPIEIPADARPGQVERLTAKAQLLVCADVCVPQDANVALDLPVVAGAATADPVWGPAIAKTLADAPKAADIAAAYQSTGGSLKIALAGAALAGHPAAGAYFYPYDAETLDQAKPQAIDRGDSGFTLAASAGAAFQKGPPAEIQGVIETADGAAFEVTAKPGPPPPGSGGLGAPSEPAKMGLAVAALFAFLGGIILNLMPCVFPILSMKAAAFAGHGGETMGAREQGLAFAGGVLASFLALAGLLMAARAAGQAVGWGFELQSPMVTGALALVILAAALNLSGLFEVGASAQGLGAKLASRGGIVGAAFTGALAVVVAAPCTAPFMGPALGFALTQSPATGLAVFAALAVGFALPFTALAFTPALIRRLPRPGPWMDVLRKGLAFPMYGTAAWLVWVLGAQTDRTSLAAVFAAAVALAFAAWIWGAAQRRVASGRRAWVVNGLAALALFAAVAVLVVAPYGPPPQQGAAAAETVAGIAAEPWSAEKVAALQAQGKPVLVDFTAAWCVTCQVNEQVALNTGEAAQAFKRTGAVLLKADWTNRDAAIAKALADQGRVGVPLYLVYAPGGGAPKVLPQLLTSGIVAEALDDAARPLGSAGK